MRLVPASGVRGARPGSCRLRRRRLSAPALERGPSAARRAGHGGWGRWLGEAVLAAWARSSGGGRGASAGRCPSLPLAAGPASAAFLRQRGCEESVCPGALTAPGAPWGAPRSARSPGPWGAPSRAPLGRAPRARGQSPRVETPPVTPGQAPR